MTIKCYHHETTCQLQAKDSLRFICSYFPLFKSKFGIKKKKGNIFYCLTSWATPVFMHSSLTEVRKISSLYQPTFEPYVAIFHPLFLNLKYLESAPSLLIFNKQYVDIICTIISLYFCISPSEEYSPQQNPASSAKFPDHFLFALVSPPALFSS